MFNETSIILREVCNGMMFVSAFILIVLFASFLWREVARDKHCWVRDPVCQSAIVIILLLVGHGIRAFAAWMQFLWMDIGWDADFWTNSIELFIAATVIIVTAKQFMVIVFSSEKWRWPLTALTLVLTVVIPMSVALSVASYNKRLEDARMRVTDATLVKPPADGRMTIRYHATRKAICPTVVDVAIANRENDTIVWRHRGEAILVSEEWQTEVNIPRLNAGRYIYYTTFRALCSDTRVYATETPPIAFEVK